MSLMKWFRRNNKKIMAVVVIVIMVGFIGGTYIEQLGRRGVGLEKAIARFGDNREITNNDLVLAHQELEILGAMGMNILLRSQDLRTILLGELLFSERRPLPELINALRQAIRVSGYRISDKQINDIYRRSLTSEIYWLLLEKEAQLVGVRIPDNIAGEQLGRIVPQLFNGTTYSQVVRSLINRHGISEKQVLRTFGKLLSVLEYAMIICSSEDVTGRQIMHNVSKEEETIALEFVKLDSSVFAETEGQPSEQEISEHFERYKKFFAGDISEENPYGFGYKLPDRVKLEYMAVKLDDISSIVTPPTPQEAEEYYQKHTREFMVLVPLDPNDPNSPTLERLKSYTEVASAISNGLLQSKINSKAEMILQEAKALTEVGFEDTDVELGDSSVEQFKQTGVDYTAVADELSKKHKVNVYAGQTGLLSAADFRTDKYLVTLYVRGYGEASVRLAQLVFAIDELGVSELGPFDAPKPRMYENIEPVKDMLGRIMAAVRVIKAEKACEPEGINQSFGKSRFRFEQVEELPVEDVYLVREKVAEDLKKLAAMDTTKNKAEELIELAAEKGWEEAIEEFNQLYGRQDKQDEGEPNVFELQNFTNLRRFPILALRTLAVQNEGYPESQSIISTHKKEAQLIDRFYQLVPQDSNTVDTVGVTMEFKPGMSYYCIKGIHVERLDEEQYEGIKASQVYKEETVQSQSLTVVHFNPENIVKRMNFRWVKQEKETIDANTPAESEETL